MDFALQRSRMVQRQLRGRGITDERVLTAMEETPRHVFVPEHERKRAYEDEPLPIGLGQTISQPYMVARMTELLALTGSETVLEIGTGSGYQAAVLGRLTANVWTVERHPELASRAERVLTDMGLENVRVVLGDGTLGLPGEGPFGAVIVTAAAPRVPMALREQLAIDGRMVIPVSSGHDQELMLIEKLAASGTVAAEGQGPGGEPVPCWFRETAVLGCVFVPLVGEQGYRR